MPFTDDDRNKLAEIHADVKTLKANDNDKETRLRNVEGLLRKGMGFIAAIGLVISAVWAFILENK